MSNYATLKISLPQTFPPLYVTSYTRPTGSHATGRAWDMSIGNLKSTTPPDDPLWYYYLGYTLTLFGNLRSGTCRFSLPPKCPHWHSETGTDRIIGWEYITSINGHCVVDPAVKDPIKNYPYKQKERIVRGIKEMFENAGYGFDAMGFFSRLRENYMAASSAWRYPRVYTQDLISVSDLQSKLDANYGDGTIQGNVFDEINHALGYENLENAPKPQELIDSGKKLLYLSGAGYVLYWLYQLAKEIKYWDTTSN